MIRKKLFADLRVRVLNCVSNYFLYFAFLSFPLLCGVFGAEIFGNMGFRRGNFCAGLFSHQKCRFLSNLLRLRFRFSPCYVDFGCEFISAFPFRLLLFPVRNSLFT